MKKAIYSEDSLLERKTESYRAEDFLKTFVAFANSVRPNETATVLIGEDDNGEILGVTNPDEFQIKVRKIIDKIYPAIIWHQETYRKRGKTCIKVEISYSGDTPHFGGSAWVRKGSESIRATDEVFQKLIEIRLDKVRELTNWLGKAVTVHGDPSNVPPERNASFGALRAFFSHRWGWEEEAVLITANRFWVTFTREKGNLSEPIEKLLLSWDDERNRLKIIVKY